MKKTLSSLLLLAVAAVAFSSCNKEELNNEVNDNDVFVVNVKAETIETKSQFGTPDGASYPVLWDVNYNVNFSLDGAKFVASAPSPSESQLESNFTVSFSTNPKVKGGVIYGFSPAGDYYSTPAVGGFSSFHYDNGFAYLVIPSNQKPLSTSVDPTAQALYGSVEYDESGVPDPVKMVFDHAVAYGKMTISNYASDYELISITFPYAVAGNSCKYYFADKNGFCAGDIDNAQQKTIYIDPTNVTNNVVWFAIAPTGIITSGDIVVEIVNTKGHKYTKTIALSSQKSIAFNAGEISKFTVNMNGIQPASDAWTLVTDSSTLKAGDQLVIASNENGKTAGAISSGYMAAVSSTFSADKRIITALGDNTVILTLGGEKDAWTLSSNSDLLGVSSAKVSWNGTDNTNTWSISISDDCATISSTNYDSNGRFLYNVNSPRFKPYTSSPTTSMLLPQLYKKSSVAIDTRTPRNLAYSSSEATAVIGEKFTAPVLSGTTDGGVVYSSSKESVATIDTNGYVTIIAAGTTIITATAAANETYQEGVAAYTLTVVAPKITSVEGITTWAWNSTESQTLTVKGSNLHGITVDDTALANFELVYDGYEILANPIGNNESGADFEESFTVSATDGNTYTVKLKQIKKPVASANYVKAASIESGKQYLVYYNGTIATGVVASKKMVTTSASLTGGYIAGTDAIDACAITFVEGTGDYAGYYSIFSSTTKNYVGNNSGTDMVAALTATSDGYYWSVSFNPDGTALIVNKGSGRFLGWNNTDSYKAYVINNLGTYPLPTLYVK